MNSLRLVKEKINSDLILKEIKPALEKYPSFLVGGCIRDYFLGIENHDRDIVCAKHARELSDEIAAIVDGTLIELDCENEIFRIILKDKINYFDVSRALDDNIPLDAKRRDFTLNSIFFDLNKNEIFDPYNGICALEENLLKTADIKNFEDDPLRMLRAFRFMALYNFKIDDEILDFIKNNSLLIKKCAPERINQELMKLFSGKWLKEALILADECELLNKIFPFVDEIKKIPPNTHHHLDLFHHSLETAAQIRINNPLLKLAAFCHDIGKPQTHTIEESGRHRFIGHDDVGSKLIKPILSDLKFSKKQIEYISLMIKNHIYPSALMREKPVQDKAKIRFIKKLNPYVEDIIELARADRLCARGPMVTDTMVEENLANLEELREFYLKIKPAMQALPKLLDGREIMEILNIKPSKVLGQIIEALHEAQIEGKVKTSDEAKVFIREYFATYCKEM